MPTLSFTCAVLVRRVNTDLHFAFLVHIEPRSIRVWIFQLAFHPVHIRHNTPAEWTPVLCPVLLSFSVFTSHFPRKSCSSLFIICYIIYIFSVQELLVIVWVVFKVWSLWFHRCVHAAHWRTSLVGGKVSRIQANRINGMESRRFGLPSCKCQTSFAISAFQTISDLKPAAVYVEDMVTWSQKSNSESESLRKKGLEPYTPSCNSSL